MAVIWTHVRIDHQVLVETVSLGYHEPDDDFSRAPAKVRRGYFQPDDLKKHVCITSNIVIPKKTRWPYTKNVHCNLKDMAFTHVES